MCISTSKKDRVKRFFEIYNFGYNFGRDQWVRILFCIFVYPMRYCRLLVHSVDAVAFIFVPLNFFSSYHFNYGGAKGWPEAETEQYCTIISMHLSFFGMLHVERTREEEELDANPTPFQ